MNQYDKRLNLTRWLIWSILVFGYAINYFYSFSMGVVKDSLITEFALSESLFVSIANTYSIMYLLMQIPTGILVDTLGAKKTAFWGTLFTVIGIFIFCKALNVPMLLLGRSLIGLGASVSYICILKIQSKWFPSEKFATMTGYTCFIGAFGGVFAQTPLAYATELFGWRVTFFTIGILSFLIALAILFFVSNSPQERGFNQICSGDEDTSIPSFKELLNAIKEIFSNPKTWPPFIIYATFYGSFVILAGFWGVSFISDTYNISTIASSSFISAVVIGSAFGASVIGNLSDKYRTRRKPAVYSGILYCLSWFILIFFTKYIPLPALMILMFAIGFFSYGYVISWPVVKEVNNPKYMGISSAVANIGGFAGSIILPIVAGFIFDNISLPLDILYKLSFGAILIIIVLGTVASLFVSETKCESIYKHR